MTTGRKKPAEEREPDTEARSLPAGWQELERRLGHRFRNAELLALALTHRSHTYEARHGVPELLQPARPEQRNQRNAPGTDNEQLEFLGDAVLGLLVAEALFREFPQCGEGELTRLRANLVSRKRMAEMGSQLGLGEALRMGKSAEFNGGRSKPALLANAAEAVLAAVYLDAGKEGLQSVRRIVERYLLLPEMEAMRAAVAQGAGRGALRDPKTVLQERVQAEGLGKLRYVDTAESGPAHRRCFCVEAHLMSGDGEHVLSSAQGSSKKEAQQRAAELALQGWNHPDRIQPALGQAPRTPARGEP
jgi:ribonuclease-3